MSNLLDRYLAPNTPEAQAHNHIQSNANWEDDAASLNETLMALCASYCALARYISGADIYLMPRSTTQLESKLRRYAYDAIHNTVSKSRTQLEQGGYSRACHLAEQSIRNLLRTNNNAADLLALHQRHDAHHAETEDTPTRQVKVAN